MNDTIQLAGESMRFDRAYELLTAYADGLKETVRWYDLGGKDEVIASDGIGLHDIGRAAVIAARFKAEDVPRILNSQSEIDWQAVPRDARLEDADPEISGGLYDAANQMYTQLAQIPGVKAAKVTKLLHIKRPWLFPVFDKEVCRAYSLHASQMVPDNRRIWTAMRNDLIANEVVFRLLRERIERSDVANVRSLASLPNLRLLDILAWKVGKGPLTSTRVPQPIRSVALRHALQPDKD